GSHAPRAMARGPRRDAPVATAVHKARRYRTPRGSRLGNGNADHDVALLNRVDDIRATRDLAEHRVLAVQVRRRDVRDEELAAVRVRTGVRHRDHAALMPQRIAFALVGESITGPAATRAR